MADRRGWTTDEEDLLITILQDIVIEVTMEALGQVRMRLLS